MKGDKTQLAIGAALLGAFAGIWRWHNPKAKKLTPQEIDYYLDIIAKLPLPDHHVDDILPRIRAWAEADDGKPVYMLNMIRFFPELRRWEGAPEFDGTPEEANAYYEKSLTKLWLKHASYPMVGGKVEGQNLIATQPDQPDWSTAEMVRYPSRRRFLKLLSDPSYGPLEPYKFMALEIDLVPVSGDKVIPDFRWLAGGSLLAFFLGLGWARSSWRKG
jgi:hypothetical protein